MTREEAIEHIKMLFFKGLYTSLSNKTKEAFDILIPELHESEDERIRKGLIEALKASKTVGELKFIIPEPTREECIAYLEKQKDSDKAIHAVDRIDKYIDENVANAHDMKDSNPDKKYYLGWDDALGKMAGILQDVYSGEKQKEQKPTGATINGEPVPTENQSVDIPLAEWSEEDENAITTAIRACRYMTENFENSTKPYEDAIERLKSLRPSWKPSEEQIYSLGTVVNGMRESDFGVSKNLRDLYEQLKKL